MFEIAGICRILLLEVLGVWGSHDNSNGTFTGNKRFVRFEGYVY